MNSDNIRVRSIPLKLPRPVRAIHQIELSSRCNLACKYCPHGATETIPTGEPIVAEPGERMTMTVGGAVSRASTLLGTEARPKMDMSWETFNRTLLLVDHYNRIMGTAEQQKELNLAGIGESLLHPRFVEMVELAAHVTGANQPGSKMLLNVTTNGLLVSDDMMARLKPTGVKFYVSLHRPEKAGPAVEILRKHDMLLGVSMDPSMSAVDWAGQVPWHVSSGVRACPWIRDGLAFVFADGRISTCCFDASAQGVIGHVNDPPGYKTVAPRIGDVAPLTTAPYDICAHCDQQIAVDGYAQYPTGKYEQRRFPKPKAQRGALPVLT